MGAMPLVSATQESDRTMCTTWFHAKGIAAMGRSYGSVTSGGQLDPGVFGLSSRNRSQNSTLAAPK